MNPDQWRQVVNLYEAAQDCTPDQLATLTEKADPEVRSLVERMLSTTGVAFLDEPITEWPNKLVAGLPTPGSLLGPYRIEALIGTGGTGRVYCATDTRLERRVALKILDIGN